MTTAHNYQEIAKKNVERATRVQLLRAMEKMLIGLGSKRDYIAWLEALPEDAKIGSAGNLDNAAITQVAENETLYHAAMKVFAERMGPVLMTIAAEVIEL